MPLRRLAGLALLVLAASCSDSGGQDNREPAAAATAAVEVAQPVPLGTGFDFYVLALSWSPSYCEAEGPQANRQQCAAGRDHRFVVHGLWPQFESGYPEFCRMERDRVPDDLVRRMLDIMPSAGLIGHQWRKHGSCSGLGQEAYFEVVRAARERIDVPERFASLVDDTNIDPDGMEDAFLAANGGLDAGAIAVTCDGERLREVRICLSKELDFRDCPEVDRRSCRRGVVELPAPDR